MSDVAATPDSDHDRSPDSATTGAAAATGPAGSEAPGLAPRPPASLSPSRASDFMGCPLRYRFRTIDRLPEQPSIAAVRGTLVHAVLERLFDESAAERTPVTAHALVEPAWRSLVEQKPSLPGLLFGPEDNWARSLAGDPLLPADPAAEGSFLSQAGDLLDNYFDLEDPRYLEPESREAAVSTRLHNGLTLRGIIDRVDVARTGEVRIVDYKTGRSPRPQWQDSALFQMRFYGLVHWIRTGVVPTRLQLVYLGDTQLLTFDPTEAQLRATQRKLEALWETIEGVVATGDWQPKPSKLCDWCSFRDLCPAFGGTPPPLPRRSGTG